MAYVYRHIRHDKNEPFYIGICKKDDPNYNRAFTTIGRNNLWKNIVSKTTYSVDILIDNIDYDFAKIKEIEFIKLYGRHQFNNGTLANMTIGGDGVVGRLFTKELRKKISDSAKNRIRQKHKPETIEVIRQKNLGKIVSQETRNKLRELNLGKIPSNKGVRVSQAHYIKILETQMKRRVAVLKYSIMGEFICKYDSIIEAAKINNLNQGNISNSCINKIMYGGFMWRYMSNNFILNIEPYKQRIFPVLQYTLSGVLVAEYKSAMYAQKQTGIQKSSILRVCNGQFKQASGYKWVKKK